MRNKVNIYIYAFRGKLYFCHCWPDYQRTRLIFFACEKNLELAARLIKKKCIIIKFLLKNFHLHESAECIKKPLKATQIASYQFSQVALENELVACIFAC